jgi:outer membrane receptor protein involved in Fe transport
MKQLIYLCLFTFSTILAGQSLEGIVVDAATGQPVPFATISVFAGDQLVDGTTASEEGRFRQKLLRGATHIEVSFLAYKNQRLDLPLASPLQIRLQEEGSLLDEVTVTASRTTTELKIDRKVVNFGADLQQAGTTALEAFNQIAEVQVDYGGGRLSLRGSGNVKLLINGKPSSLTPMEILEQLPSNQIDRVEIITAPSAREQANGLAGIINVITKKDQDEGFKMALNGSIGAHPNGLGQKHSLGSNGNLRRNKTNFRFLASRSERAHTADNKIQRNFSDGTGMNIFTPHIFDGVVSKAQAGIDLFMNEHHRLSFDVSYTDDRHDFNNVSSYSGLSGRDSYDHLRASSHFHRTGEAGVNYLQTFGSKEHTLEFDYQFTRNTNDYPAYDVVEGLPTLEETFYQANDLHALSLDFVRPINDTWTMEIGLAWNGRNLDSNHDYAPAAAPNTFATFEFRENVIGLYGQLQFK